jgi:hypothetical protein
MKKARILVLISMFTYILGIGLISAIFLPDLPNLASSLRAFLQISCFVVFIWGCVELAKAKGYHPIWGMLGILQLIGLIILIVLPNKNKILLAKTKDNKSK